MTNKPKTFDELRIKCAKAFSKIEALNRWPYKLYSLKWGLEPHVYWKLTTDFPTGMQENIKYGPYLKIEDESPYSAVRILRKLGYQVIWSELKHNWYLIFNKDFKTYQENLGLICVADLSNKFAKNILEDLEGYQINLAHCLAIKKRLEIDRESVIKVLEDIKNE